LNHPLNPNNGSAHPTHESVGKLVNPWFAVAVIGLFVFACLYVLKVVIDLFLPIVLAGFLGFLLTPITRWLKKIGLPNFWAPLIGTLGFFTVFMCLFAALCASLARFEPDLPLYLDHIQERLTPILQAVQKSSPSIDRLGAWLNPGNVLQVSTRGPSFLEIALKKAPKFFAILVIVHVLAFFLLLYGARLLKKLVDMIPEGIMAKRKGSRYLPGRRSENWLKIKARMQQEAVIGGITEPSGGRHYFEALMLGVYDKGRLLYVGHTGTGFSEPLLKDLFAKLRPYFTNRCPFTPKPKGLRDDKDPFVADHQHILLWRNVVTDRQVKLRGNGFGCSGRS
jgi:AI-2E family transporter/ATP dependent DNA ligase C terminal region/ATP dependent DNA ligase domain